MSRARSVRVVPLVAFAFGVLSLLAIAVAARPALAQPVDECPDDPAKTAPGACGCGQPDADADQDGRFECPFLVTAFDTQGNVLPDATFFTEDGQFTTTGGALVYELGASVRFRVSWKNATQWTSFFLAPTTDALVPTVHCENPATLGALVLEPVTPGDGLRIDAIFDRGPVTVLVKNVDGNDLPTVDVFGNTHSSPYVTTDYPNVLSGPSGSSGEVAYNYQLYFHGRWSAAGIWYWAVPYRDTTRTIHGSEVGTPVTSAPSAGSFVVFEYERITITVESVTTTGQPSGGSVGVEGWGYHAAPWQFEAPAGHATWFYRLNVNLAGYGSQYPFVYPAKGGVQVLDGTNAASFVTPGAQTFRVTYPPPDLCPNDPAKTEPGVCGCGVADSPCGCGVAPSDDDSDGHPECPVRVDAYDQGGQTLAGARFRLASGAEATTGGTLTLELDTPLSIAVAWRNADLWSAETEVSIETLVPTIHADGTHAIGAVTLDPVAAGGGLRVRAILETRAVVYDLVDRGGVALPMSDAFGRIWDARAVGDTVNGAGHAPGTSLVLAARFDATFVARWRNGLISRTAPVPGAGEVLTIHGSDAGQPWDLAASPSARVAFELDRRTLSIEAVDSHGVAIPDALAGVAGAGPDAATPYHVEVAVPPGPGAFEVIVGASWPGHYARRDKSLAPVVGSAATIDGTDGSGAATEGLAVTFVYPAPVVCGDGFLDPGESCPEDDSCEPVAEICGVDGAGGRILWGVLELADGGLAGFRCVVAAEGEAPVCDTVEGSDVLLTHPPKCE